MKKAIFVLLLIIGIASLTGCGNNTIVGKWVQGSYIYEFKSNGTCSYNTGSSIIKCKYKTKDNNLSITYDGNTSSFDTTYSIKGNKLNIKDSFGNDTIYIKK